MEEKMGNTITYAKEQVEDRNRSEVENTYRSLCGLRDDQSTDLRYIDRHT